ncbi:MAG: hypothetical protein HKN60_08130, partial [Rhizobiales bacterium]|nr:hypothetical protein [Hyphomicrobiales bacterium]
DLHWIDAESERVLNQVIDGMAAQRLLLVANYRPEYSHNWSQKGLFQQIRLGALTAPETEDFVETLLGPDPSVAHLRPLLAEKSDGTPLFLEELVRMLAETGSLVGEQGDFTAPEPITELQIPPSVKPIIAARIDRLADDQRRVLQIASVIGKDVPRPILKELSGLERHDLDTIIAHLSQTEFLFELQSYPETEYTFKHALTHDVAYESLMAEERKRIHAEALRLMERLYQDQLDQNAERLADHALKAEEWGAAVKYLVAATDRALDHAAYSKAARFLEHAAGALDKLERTPERIAQAIDIRTRMRPALEGTGQYSLSLAWLDEAEKLATELGDTDRLEQVILHKSYANSTHGRLDTAIEDADRLRKIATEAGDNRYAAEANLAAAQALIFRHVANQVLERLEPHEADFTGQWRMERFGLLGTRSVFFLGYMSISASLTGEFARAHALAEAMNQVVHESGRPIDRYAAAYHESMVHILAGPSREYEARLAALAEECRVRAPSPFYCVVMSRLGHVRLLCRGPEEACETLEEAKSYATHSDMPHISAYSDAIRACAEAEASGPEALTALESSLQVVRDMGDPWVEIQLLRAVADVCEPVDALKHLSTAEAIATANGFRPDLARIHAARAEIAELHDAKLATRAAKQAHALFTELGLEPETAR